MEWISVKDDLPTHRTHVIGYCKLLKKYEFEVIPLFYENDQHGKRWAYLFAHNEGYDEVIKWMPLPEPPILMDQKDSF